MAILEHPAKGSIITCDFDQGFCEPEMVKRRPVIVLSPKITSRPKLCTVVALSTTAPMTRMPYHAQLDIYPPLPHPFNSKGLWIKGDMVYAVGFHRLDFIRIGKEADGKRIYYYNTLNNNQIKLVQKCMLNAMGLSYLTKHLE